MVPVKMADRKYGFFNFLNPPRNNSGQASRPEQRADDDDDGTADLQRLLDGETSPVRPRRRGSPLGNPQPNDDATSRIKHWQQMGYLFDNDDGMLPPSPGGNKDLGLLELESHILRGNMHADDIDEAIYTSSSEDELGAENNPLPEE